MLGDSTSQPCSTIFIDGGRYTVFLFRLLLNPFPGFFFSVADPGCFSRISDPNFFIPDPNFYHPGSRISIKEFKYFNHKKWFLSSRKYDPGCSSRIRIPDPDPDFLPIPDPRSRGQKGTGYRIRICNIVFCTTHLCKKSRANPPLILITLSIKSRLF